jgi:hypothetical protein
VAELRRNWFVEFERCCRAEFAEAFRGRKLGAWRLDIREDDWKVHAWLPGTTELLTVTLPYNYLLFRAGSVAENAVTRLWEQARQAQPMEQRVAS